MALIDTEPKTAFAGAQNLLAELAQNFDISFEHRSTGRDFSVDDPATGTSIAFAPDGDQATARAAVDRAQLAAAAWARTTPRERSDILRCAFDLMKADRERIAELISWENGKARADALSEADYAAEFFRWYSEEAVRSDGEFGAAPAGGSRIVVTQSPVGTCALVTPWNFPAAMVTRKVAPALAAGCTAVLKPAGETPLTAFAIAHLLAQAGLPHGVLGLVTTSASAPVVTTWLEDPRVRKLSFTGSTPVGRHLLAQAAPRVIRTSMELGGNAPFIVTADADIDAAVAGAMTAKFRNGGQACTAANRFYVHQSVYEAFTTRFGSAIEQLKVGPAIEAATAIGPLINAKAVIGVARLVDDALAAGARISHQAEAPDDANYYPPTLLVDVPPTAAILAEEIFGPVAPVVAWNDEEDLLTAVNSSELGLAAYVFARDTGHGMRLAERIEAGMVGVNRGVVSDPAAPFGGFKQSGLGREGSREGIREFQETQYFSVDW
jgi:succinate-semialdehyde dehydrogenase/glutarate-semialdehyde dehydrogenase